MYFLPLIRLKVRLVGLQLYYHEDMLKCQLHLSSYTKQSHIVITYYKILLLINSILAHRYRSGRWFDNSLGWYFCYDMNHFMMSLTQ